MLRATLERLLFGALLIVFLQVPVLSEYYIQYLAGYVAANQDQVEQLNRLASSNQFSSTQALIDSLKRNNDPIVRQDADNKLQLLLQHQQLQADKKRLQTGNYVQRLFYLLNPTQYPTLVKVLNNFKPGIPLAINDLLASVGFALLFSLLIWLPFARHSRRRKIKFNRTVS